MLVILPMVFYISTPPFFSVEIIFYFSLQLTQLHLEAYMHGFKDYNVTCNPIGYYFYMYDAL